MKIYSRRSTPWAAWRRTGPSCRRRGRRVSPANGSAGFGICGAGSATRPPDFELQNTTFEGASIGKTITFQEKVVVESTFALHLFDDPLLFVHFSAGCFDRSFSLVIVNGSSAQPIEFDEEKAFHWMGTYFLKFSVQLGAFKVGGMELFLHLLQLGLVVGLYLFLLLDLVVKLQQPLVLKRIEFKLPVSFSVKYNVVTIAIR